jgi:uncharacterized LabA/DUF88 family protein
VTTQNTHPEQSDVEESVVKYQSVSDTGTDSPPPTQEASTTNETLPLAATQNVTQEEQNSKPALVSQRDQAASGGAATEDSTSDAQTTSKPVAESEVTPPAASLEREEKVRPFTAFMEEFRQAETRFGSPLSTLPAYSDDPLATTPALAEQQETQSTPRSELPDSRDKGGQLPHISPIDDAQSRSEETQSPSTAESATSAQETPIPVVRPVSPLLRPPSPRSRSRHGAARQREEAPVAKEESAQKTEAEQTVPAVVEPVSLPIEEQPRPARRYRFDRPAATNAPVNTPALTPSTPVRPEENKELPTRAENGQHAEKEIPTTQQGKQTLSPPSENATATQADAPEAPAPATTAVPEHGRGRRHAQERQRAKTQAPTPPTPATTPGTTQATTPAVPVAESAQEVVEAVVPPGEEEHPEDLPPLEYSELQKASSRRRRRRHSSATPASPVSPTSPASTVNAVPLPAAVKPVTAETAVVPLPTPTPPVVMPRIPTPAQASQITITSGYTVNQMNQSRDGSNPFMGPEPSPARGTMAAQNVRSIRTDAQRTPAYPVRTTEANSASVHQLANVVAQAIQTQTDRMIAELRRANQSPTNVSVSMPPFPSTERVGVFVDVANLLYSARTLRMTVDFGKLLDFLRGNRRLVRAHAYCPTSPQPGDEQMFLQAVKGLGYRITTKNYKTFSSGAKKADLDLDLCMDVVRLVDGRAVDCIVLVSGDSDFMPLLDYCSDHGVRVEVAAFDEAMSATLRQSCDLFINLSMLEEIRA